MERPECFKFALDFIGGPENEIMLEYIESLEKRIALLESAKNTEQPPQPDPDNQGNG